MSQFVTGDPRGVSLVIPNYNGRDLLTRNVPTWVAAARTYVEATRAAAEVVVVDDGSKDDSVAVLEALAKGEPLLRPVRHERNKGFGAACRTGVEAAHHPIAVLLNSDVRVEAGFARPLVAPFQRDPSVFSVSPLILDRDGKPAKVTVNLPVVRRGDLRWEGVDPDDLLALSRLDEAVPLDVPSLFGLGGAVAVVRERFLALGGFDPLYAPFYHEDVDLGLMAWRRGWRVLVEPRSRVLHEDGGTIGKHFARLEVKVARHRNRILCMWKHAEGAWRTAHGRGLLLRALTRWLRLDRRFYLALRAAWSRRAQALAAREREEREGRRSLRDVFPEIAASWPPKELAQARARQ